MHFWHGLILFRPPAHLDIHAIEGIVHHKQKKLLGNGQMWEQHQTLVLRIGLGLTKKN
jgi:hypothetical protein